jgi:hypothetical protein
MKVPNEPSWVAGPMSIPLISWIEASQAALASPGIATTTVIVVTRGPANSGAAMSAPRLPEADRSLLPIRAAARTHR